LVVDDRRRVSFGSVAEQYDQSRPSYPAGMVDDALEYAGAGESDRAIEVGAGTGKATALFAARGLRILAIEPSGEMAAVARRNCAGYENVTIVETEFERYRPAGHEFRLVFSGQAWHWISPDVKYVAARAALEDGGALAAFWNRPEWDACDLRDDIGEAYRRHGHGGETGDPMNPTAWSGDGAWSTEIAGASGFEAAEVRCYRWHADYTAAEYVALLSTHSPCLVLDPPEREGLLAEIGATIDAHGGTLRIPFVTELCQARAA
jgi:SAM-dependent methyltransferase